MSATRETALTPADTTFLDTPSAASTLKALEDAIGGRSALVETLAHAPQSDGLAYVINLIADPSSDARTLAAICKAGHITLGELLEAYKRGEYARMQVQVVRTIAAKAPAVVDDVLTRAAPHLIVCPACQGGQQVLNEDYDPKDDGSERWRPCVCVKTATPGWITALPSVDRQKLALDVAHLLPQKGPAVVVNAPHQHTHFDATPAGFSSLLKDTDETLHRRGRTGASAAEVIDAEVEVGAPSSPVDDGYDAE